MTYVVPQVQVFQEISAAPASTLSDLPAWIAGGHAYLLRYAEDDEKVLAALGQYIPNAETDYLWPQRPTGGIVDDSYTKLFIDDAMLHYYNSTDSGDTVLTVAGRSNRVRAAAVSFKSNGADFPHSGVFIDRGVEVGDMVRVQATVDSVLYELCTYVAGFVSEVIASDIDAVEIAEENAVNTSNSFAAVFDSTLVGTLDNCIDTVTKVGNYAGLASGTIDSSDHLGDIYRVEVVQGSVDEDYTTARFRITSDYGHDDVANAAIEDGVLAVGTQGLTVSFSVSSHSAGTDCSLSATNQDIAPYDFVVGQRWIITVKQVFTAPTVASSGTYDGTADDIYVVEITRGRGTGSLSTSTAAQFSVRTVKGLDVSGPTKILLTTAYDIGTHGAKVAFSSTSNLRKGDRWYVPVTAAAAGANKTIELGRSLPTEVIDNGATSVILDLYIRRNIEVTPNRVGFSPSTNWTQTQSQFTVDDGILGYDPTYTDDGEPVALPVVADCGYSNMFVEARYWRTDLSTDLGQISDVSQLNDLIPGALSPDNPLKYGVFKALQNSNGVTVGFTSVCDPDDVDQWDNALNVISEKREAYGLVPLTRNPEVWSLFQAHAADQSSPEFGRWRVCWFNSSGDDQKVIVNAANSTNTEEVLAVVEDDPFVTGVQFTQVRVPAGNCKFVTHAVRAGDVVRIEFSTDGFGGATYSEYVIDRVLNEDTLLLVSGPATSISVAEKIEIWRNLTASELAREIAEAGGFSNRRVRMVWPDTVEADGFSAVPGYFLCAALAGLSGGVAPHQGLTNLEIAGFTSIPRTTKLFGRSQLNTIAAGGIWIVSKDLSSGKVYTRDALTTASIDNLTESKEMITRNLDSISFLFLDVYAPYIGTSNVTNTVIAALNDETSSAINFLKSANFVQRLGPQLIEGVITQLRKHDTLQNRVVVVVQLTLPYELDVIEAHLQLVA